MDMIIKRYDMIIEDAENELVLLHEQISLV